MSTKDRILDAAEHLFADAGFAVTSLRDITRDAGVNLASVNYHFGSKEALLAAVLARRFAPINELRLQRLDEIGRTSGESGPELEDVLRAFIAPPFEMRIADGAGGRRVIRLLGRVHVETNDEFREAFATQFTPMFSRFLPAFQRALPDIDPTEIAARTWFLVGSMAHTMMWGEMAGPTNTSPDPGELMESLIQFGAAGLSAPVRQPVPVRSRRTGGTL